MNYTDLQYKDATQIAYLPFLDKVNTNLPAKPNGDHYTIAELVSSYVNLDAAYKRREAALGPNAKLDDPIDELKSLIQYTNLSDKNKETLLNISNDSYNWKYLACRDTNSDRGFYGCALETCSNPAEKGDLMVAFRGSENMFNSYSNDWYDWILADLGLINGKRTLQHYEVEAFAQELIDSGIIANYSDKEINVTGHSLGGNLAAYFTMYTCKEKREIFDNIGRCYNLDGPGFTEEFFKSYEPYASEACSKIVHYKASFVGNMLKSHPNETVKYIHINDEEIVQSSRIMQKLTRHDTNNWKFDENGSLTFTDGPDELGREATFLSNFIDAINLEEIFFIGSAFIFLWLIDEDKNGKPKFSVPKALILISVLGSLAITSFAVNPFCTNMILGLIALVVAVVLIDRKDLEEQIDEIIKTIVQNLKPISIEMSDYFNNLYKKIKDYIASNVDFFNRAVNYGYSYATNNPIIQVNTTNLRACAEGIDRINQRLANLDKRINYLYYTIGLIDILNILNADLNISYNNTLKRCSNYLYETASDFERTEKNVENVF